MDKFIKAWRKSSDLKAAQTDEPVTSSTHSEISNIDPSSSTSDNNNVAVNTGMCSSHLLFHDCSILMI